MAKKIIQSSGKRRTAVARARLMEEEPEKAVIRINGVPIDKIEPKFARLRMIEPLLLAKEFYNDNLSMKIRVYGGGVASRAEAVRMAIARGINEYLNSREVTEIFEDYDRTMLAGDVRRTEPKKYGGPGARARYQKSYR